MNLQNIELFADQACFSTDPPTKLYAGQVFANFVNSLYPSQFSEIMENFSQTVLYVFLQYLAKRLSKSSETLQIFAQVKNLALKWYQPNGQFKRPYDSQILLPYVSNTLGMVLGRCMKYIYLNQKNKKDLVEYVKIETNSLFKLFLYKNFIDVVSTIDNDMQFVIYRSLIYSFQQKMIPIFLEELYPYFISVTDNIKINELNSMMPSLNEKSNTGPKNFELFRQQEKHISQLVFSLLGQIVNFKFNISFTQYDMEGLLEDLMVSFPESILSSLISRQFLQAFYYMLGKMILMNYTGPYFDISFDCLKKILLSKVSHLAKQQKIQLIQLHYTGLMNLIRCQINIEKIMNQVFQCLYKFIYVFQFTDMEAAHINHLEMIMLIRQKALNVIQATQLTNQNPLYQSTCQLVSKIANQSINMSEQKYLEAYEQLCRDFYTSFFNSFIGKDYNILGKVQINKIQSLVAILKEYFQNVNKIGSMDMKFMLNVIISRCQEIYTSNNCQKISNLIFLITNICDQNFYDRNIIFQATKKDDLKLLSQLVHNTFDFIGYYKKLNQSNDLIDVAIILFIQKLLKQCLQNISNNEHQISIVSPTYKQMINSWKPIQMNDETFLLSCFEQLFQQMNTQSYQKVQHVLQVLYNHLLKIKWALRRQYFTQSRISKSMLERAIQLSKSSLQSSQALLKQRRKLFKIITILSFDDMLDSYRSNIDSVIEAISYEFKNKNYSKVVYDLSGICENIQTAMIYRYFLTRLDQSIGLKFMLNTLYQQYKYDKYDKELLQAIIYLNSRLLSDKSLRMNSKSLSHFIYQIIDHSLENITVVLRGINHQSYCDVQNQLMILCNVLFDSSYINLFLIKRKSGNKLIQFLYQVMANVSRNYKWIDGYTKLSQNMFQTVKLFFINCSQVIFSWSDQHQIQSKILMQFIQLLQCQMELCIRALQQAAESGKKYLHAQKFIQTISKLYSFMKNKRNNSLHKNSLIQSINILTTQNYQNVTNFLRSLFKVSMSNLKNSTSVLNSICVCIMQINTFYPSLCKQIFISLGISQQNILKIERLHGKMDDLQDEKTFVSTLKSWLINCPSRCTEDENLEIDY